MAPKEDPDAPVEEKKRYKISNRAKSRKLVRWTRKYQADKHCSAISSVPRRIFGVFEPVAGRSEVRAVFFLLFIDRIFTCATYDHL